jgi:hypothetical protein
MKGTLPRYGFRICTLCEGQSSLKRGLPSYHFKERKNRVRDVAAAVGIVVVNIYEPQPPRTWPRSSSRIALHECEGYP